MKYNFFQNEKISALGFGCMRFPLAEDGKTIDEELTAKMVDYAIKEGVNYFDTAWPYHNGTSELVIGNILKNYPRDSFYLASKFPGFQFTAGRPLEGKKPNEVFEKQLEKCGVEYFDFYLLHNVSEPTIPIFEDEKLGIIDYLVEQKKQGRIKHLGFSTHAQPENLEAFVGRHPGLFEFCQIQLNYLDWWLQDAKRKYDFLTKMGIPVWVMEGIRGGELAKLPEDVESRLKKKNPNASNASWAIRWIQSLPNVCVQLSGMSSMDQVIDNIKTFSDGKGLSSDDFDMMIEIGKETRKAVPCTKCRYCCEGCPQSLDIPDLIASYNNVASGKLYEAKSHIMGLEAEKRPSACIACGQCKDACPQNINVPEILKTLSDDL